MKRILCILLCQALLFSNITIPVYASGETEDTITEETVSTAYGSWENDGLKKPITGIQSEAGKVTEEEILSLQEEALKRVGLKDLWEVEFLSPSPGEETGIIYDADTLIEDSRREEPDGLPSSYSLQSVSYGEYWDTYSNYRIYNQLSKKEKKLWRAMEILYTRYLENEQNLDQGRTEYIGISGIDFSQERLQAVVEMFRYSHPQFYFLLHVPIVDYNDDYAMVAFKVYKAFANGVDRSVATKKIQSQLDQWIPLIQAKNTQEEKVRVIHDLICNKVEYNWDAYNAGNTMDEEVEFTQTAYSVFCTDETICAGYTQAFTWLCNGVGIEAFGISSPGHAYNKVKVEGDWYNMDLTGNDTGDLGVINYSFYLKSDSSLQQSLTHTPDAVYQPYLPECSKDSGSNGTAVGTLSPSTKKLSTPEILISERENGNYVDFFTEEYDTQIYYTLDGTDPSESAARAERFVYPFYTKEEAVIKAIAVADGYQDSEIAVASLKKIPVETVWGKWGDNITYELKEGGILSLEGSGELPAVAEGAAHPLEAYKTTITKVILDNRITGIGENCFAGFGELKKIEFGNSLQSIKAKAFYGCGLEELVLPPSVTQIETQAFAGCVFLEKVEIKGSLSLIGWYMFEDCISLKAVIFSQSVSKIGTEMFSGCQSLQVVVLPEGLSKIELQAFYECGSLKVLRIPSGVTTIEEQAIPAGVVIIGTAESAAQEYAAANGNTFYEENGHSDFAPVIYGQPKSGEYVYKATAKELVVEAESVDGGVLSYQWYKNNENSREGGEAIEGENLATFLPSAQQVGVTYYYCQVTNHKEEGTGATNAFVYSDIAGITVKKAPGSASLSLEDWTEGEEAKTPVLTSETNDITGAVFSYQGTLGTGESYGPTGHKPSVSGNYVAKATLPANENYEEVKVETEFTIHPAKTTDPEPENPEPENPDPENPDPENPDPENPEPENPDPENPDPENPDPENPDPENTEPPRNLWLKGLKEYIYTGKNIFQEELQVYHYKEKLEEKKDYTITYKNNRKAGTATITIKGKGNYTGSISQTFNILPADISKATVPDITLGLKNKVQKGKTTITYMHEGKEVKLKEGRDYILQYPETTPDAYKAENENPGYQVLVEGRGNYTGSTSFTQYISAKPMISKLKVGKLKAVSYEEDPLTGLPKAHRPGVKITDGGIELKENEDYTVSYSHNTMPGTAKVVITAKEGSGYTGSRTLTFKIKALPIKKATITGLAAELSYAGLPVEQKDCQLTYGFAAGEGQLGQEDYLVTYKNNEKAGTATVTFTGTGGFTGKISKTFKIKALDLAEQKQENKLQVEAIEPQDYSKAGVFPEPVITLTTAMGERVLEKGRDYTLSYTNHKKPGEAGSAETAPAVIITGKGGYSGQLKETFTILPGDLSKETVTMTVGDIRYQRKPGLCKPTVVLYDSQGKKLTAGKDYNKTIAYTYKEETEIERKTGKTYHKELRGKGSMVEKADIIPQGTVLIAKVEGINYFAGSQKTAEFTYVKNLISKARIRVSPRIYTGEEILLEQEDLQVTLAGEELVLGRDYEITGYTNNKKKGTAKVTVKGIGNYGGIKTVSFRIQARNFKNFILFSKNGTGVTGNMKHVIVSEGSRLPANTLKRKGYDFDGWNTAKDGSGTAYKDQEEFVLKTAEDSFGGLIILYAQWQIKTYNITYSMGENEEIFLDPSVYPSTYTVEDTLLLKEPQAQEGWEFLGWYTEKSYAPRSRVEMIVPGTTGDIQLYAKWKRPFIPKVEVPEEYLDLSAFQIIPSDGINDAEEIERALRQASVNAATGGVNTVYLPAGVYDITPQDTNAEGDPGISMMSNTNLIMDQNAILQVASSELEEYCVISVQNKENVVIRGGQIRGERYSHKGKKGEAGQGIGVYGSSNVSILGVSIASNWGDGIYLGTKRVFDDYVGCSNILIQDCEIYDNRRNNISLVDVDDVVIDHCLIYDVHGTAPQCGILNEPNKGSVSGDGINRRITIRNTEVRAYKNQDSPEFMVFMTHHNPYQEGYTTADTIKFENCTLIGYFGNYSGKNLSMDQATRSRMKGTYVNLR